MSRIRSFASSCGLAALLVGCVESSPCARFHNTDGIETAASSTAEPYVAHGNPYEVGDLAVRTIDINRCDYDAPAALRIHAPEPRGDYAVVVFQHGFMTRNSAYDDILRHLASHGFIVVAPQMYEPGIGPLLGNPTAAVEAELAGQITEWLPGSLHKITGVYVGTDRLGIAGHSRGGKVAWLAAVAEPSRFRAIAGVDPVDGAGGPLGNQPRVAQGRFGFELPSLVIGTELGGDCAPAGDNHVQFFEASPSPAWHIVALGHGHGDMLDETEAAAAAMFCPSGSDRARMRRLTAGLLVSFFRAALQGDETAYVFLSAGWSAPIAITTEFR